MTQIKKHSLLVSIRLAFLGILLAVKKERNLKLHLVVAALVVLFGATVGLTKAEWLSIIFIIFAVFAAETFNSAVEGICDILKEKLNLGYEETKAIRDISAGAVLLLAIASVILGLVIFLPYLLPL